MNGPEGGEPKESNEPTETNFITQEIEEVLAEVKANPVPPPDLSDIEAWQAEITEGRVGEQDTTQIMGLAVKDLRDLSRDFVERAHQGITQAQTPENKLEALITARQAAIYEYTARMYEERMQKTAEDKKISEFAKTAAEARRCGRESLWREKIASLVGQKMVRFRLKGQHF